MNDRFKFRVWDKGNKRYQGTQDWQPYLDTDGDVCFINTDDVRNYPPENYFIIEQCTGLKDKNGNLIYEGDIVKYSYGRKGIVRFGKYTGCFACGWENTYHDLIGWYLEDYYSGRLRDNTHNPMTDEDDSDFEIIGSIHEQTEQKDK